MTDGTSRPDDTESTENAGRELAAPFIPGGGPERQPPEEAIPSHAVEPEGDADAPEPDAAPEPAATEPAESLPFQAARDADEGGGGKEAVGSRPQAEAEDDFPFGAFDLEGGEGAALPELDEDSVDETAEDREMDRAWELADRLEDVARRLRDSGAAAAREGLESSDRFTALLSSLLAGYLARGE